MLQHLSIKNYALIDRLELKLNDGFSVITGETGAGKSIILGALNLVLGKRADLKALKDDSIKCVVEATFVLGEKASQRFFKENDLDFEKETIIRREILPSGKSRAFINDTPVNLTILSELAEKVIDVHSQHQTLLLSDNNYQLGMLDSFADNAKELKDYQDSYENYLALKREMARLRQLSDKEIGDTDYLAFLLNELMAAKLEPNEQETLEDELRILEHAEEIETNLGEVINLSEGQEGRLGVRSGLKSMETALRMLGKFHKDYEDLQERLESVRIEFEDIVREIEIKSGDPEFEPGTMEKLDTRLSLLLTLQKKHGVESVEALMERREELREKLESLANVEEKLRETEAKSSQTQKELESLAAALQATRQKATPLVEKHIQSLLRLLNMKSAMFEINIHSDQNFTKLGADHIQFLFTGNKGIKLQPLSKVASGGEMSRVMLALKATMAQKNNLPTIIFDEIDSGVSGETAGKIGGILNDMGKSMQVIAITHLPQIAGMGKEHYKVVKEAAEDAAVTGISHLNGEERLKELARLLSGEQISEAAMANARSLLKQEV